MLFINGYSVKLATRIQIFCTVSKLVAIAILAVGGIYKIAAGKPVLSRHMKEIYVLIQSRKNIYKT